MSDDKKITGKEPLIFRKDVKTQKQIATEQVKDLIIDFNDVKKNAQKAALEKEKNSIFNKAEGQKYIYSDTKERANLDSTHFAKELAKYKLKEEDIVTIGNLAYCSRFQKENILSLLEKSKKRGDIYSAEDIQALIVAHHGSYDKMKITDSVIYVKERPAQFSAKEIAIIADATTNIGVDKEAYGELVKDLSYIKGLKDKQLSGYQINDLSVYAQSKEDVEIIKKLVYDPRRGDNQFTVSQINEMMYLKKANLKHDEMEELIKNPENSAEKIINELRKKWTTVEE